MKKITMKCPSCGYTWQMSWWTYMITPYAQRGINKLFVCNKCGSQGEKNKKGDYKND